MMKNVVVATRKMTGIEMSRRRRTNLVIVAVLPIWMLAPLVINPQFFQGKLFSRAGTKTPHVRFDQVVAGVRIDRQNRQVLEQKHFASLQDSHAPQRGGLL